MNSTVSSKDSSDPWIFKYLWFNKFYEIQRNGKGFAWHKQIK